MGLGDRAFKKAVRQREYRERAQPQRRQNLGILEKHKDYVERAKQYHKKETVLKALRLRASTRNPDEFNFGMIKSRTKNGIHIKNAVDANKSIPSDMLKLMKSQDVGYLAVERSRNLKKLKEAEEDLALAEASTNKIKPKTHLFFAEDDEEKGQLVNLLDKQQPANKKKNSKKMDMLAELEDSPEDKKLSKKRELYNVRKERVDQLTKLERKLRLDVQLLKKGRRKKAGVDEHGFPIFKWDNQRKR